MNGPLVFHCTKIIVVKYQECHSGHSRDKHPLGRDADRSSCTITLELLQTNYELKDSVRGAFPPITLKMCEYPREPGDTFNSLGIKVELTQTIRHK